MLSLALAGCLSPSRSFGLDLLLSNNPEKDTLPPPTHPAAKRRLEAEPPNSKEGVSRERDAGWPADDHFLFQTPVTFATDGLVFLLLAADQVVPSNLWLPFQSTKRWHGNV